MHYLSEDILPFLLISWILFVNILLIFTAIFMEILKEIIIIEKYERNNNLDLHACVIVTKTKEHLAVKQCSHALCFLS